jgi:hypothetical protein
LLETPAQISEGRDWHLLPVPGWDDGVGKIDSVTIEQGTI